MVQTTLNWATALSDKGSALAAADVIPVIAVPKGTMVLNAGIEVDTATDGSTFTVDLGMLPLMQHLRLAFCHRTLQLISQ
jgi:hypothetical protein